MIPSDPSHDPPSPTPTDTERKQEEEVTATEALLLTIGLYPSTAHTLRDLPFASVDAYVHKRQQQGWNAGAIKQGLERERNQLCGQAPAVGQTAPALADWHTAAIAVCPANTAPDDVQWVAALLRDGSPPAEALALLTRRVARRTHAAGGSYAAA